MVFVMLKVLLILVIFVISSYCQDFIIPEATLEFLSPKGLRISIPETDPDVTLVAYHINLNEEFYGVSHGQWAEDILKPRNGRWVYEIKNLRVRPGDTIYYWVYAIRSGIGYQNLNRSFRFSGNILSTYSPLFSNESPSGSETPIPVEWKQA